MARQRKHRGVSLGTVVMLVVTAVVVLGFALILPKLASNTDVVIDTGKVLQALSLGDHLPELNLSPIPITTEQHTSTKQPAAAETTAPGTPEPTVAPAIFAPVATVVPTAAPTATPVPGGSFTATFGGSVIVSSELRQEHYYSEAKKYDFSDILVLLKDEMAADISMVTLENVILPDVKLSDTNTTSDVLPMLATSNVNLVALGYRNAYDHGAAGVASTVAAVNKAGMDTVGAYVDQASAAMDAHIHDVNGVRVALLHYTDVLSDKGKKAIKKDGTPYAVPADAVSDGADTILSDVQAVKEQGAQVVIVSLSWSAASGKSAPTKKQVAFAQQLADAGVDVIIGAGSRVVQPVTWLTGKLADGSAHKTLCAYSLGSLVNGSRTNANVAGMLLHLEMTYDGQQVLFDKLSYTPTYIWRFKQDGRYYYRVVASHLPAPDGMSDSQKDSMERALTNVQKYLGGDTPLVLR